MPGEVIEAFIAASDGTRGFTSVLLLLMLYTKEQARRGGVHAYNRAVENDLQLSPKQIKRAQTILKDAGILSQVGTEGGTPVWTLSFLPASPEKIIFERTIKHTTQKEKASIRLPHTDDEWSDEDRAELKALSLSKPSDLPSRSPLTRPLEAPHRQEDQKTSQLLTSFGESGGCATFEEVEDEAPRPSALDELRACRAAGELSAEEFDLQSKALVPF